MGDADHRRIAQLRKPRELDDLPERAHVEQSRRRGRSPPPPSPARPTSSPRSGAEQRVAELDAHDLAEAPAAQLVLDGLQQVGGVVGDLEIGVAGDAEDVVVDDLHPREEHVEVVGDDVLEWHERRARGPGGAPGLGSSRGARSATKRGRISVGTFTRANTVWSVTGSRTSTARLSERFEMYGKGRPGATASGVRAGKIVFWKCPARYARCSSSSSSKETTRIAVLGERGAQPVLEAIAQAHAQLAHAPADARRSSARA